VKNFLVNMRRSTSLASTSERASRSSRDFKDSSKEKAFLMVAKNQSPWRWMILVLGCFMLLGPYYCFDTPGALYTQLKQRMDNPDDYEFKFNLIYTLYSAPNVSNNCNPAFFYLFYFLYCRWFFPSLGVISLIGG
jgi:hypothetical protein